MTIRLGSTEWVSLDILYAADLNDTFNFTISSDAKDIGRNEINQAVLFDDASLAQITPNLVEKYTVEEGLNDTVDTTNTTSEYNATDDTYENISNLISQITGTSNVELSTTISKIAMEFTAAETGDIDIISLRMAKYTGFQDVIYSVQIFLADGSGFPTGSVIGEITGNEVDVLPGSKDWITFNFSTAINLIALTNYVVVVNITDMGTASAGIMQIEYLSTGSQVVSSYSDSWSSTDTAATATLKIYLSKAETEIVMSWNKGTPTDVIVEVYDGALDFVDIGDVTFQLTDSLPVAPSNFYYLNSNVVDATGDSDGTASGISYVTGIVSNAASFDGTNDYINTNKIISGASVGFSIWWKRTSTDTGSKNLLGLGVSDSTPGIKVTFSNNNLSIVMGAYNPLFTSMSELSDGNWHNLIVNAGANGGYTMLDGVLIDEELTPQSSPLTTANEVQIGRTYAVDAYRYFFDGIIDSVAFFEGELSKTDALAFWNSGAGYESIASFPAQNETTELDINTPNNFGTLAWTPKHLKIIQKDTTSSKIGAVWARVTK